MFTPIRILSLCSSFTFYAMALQSAEPVLSVRPAVRIDFDSAQGRSYQVLTSADASTWQSVGEPVNGTGGRVTVFYDRSVEERLFFKVQDSLGSDSALTQLSRSSISSNETFKRLDLQNFSFDGIKFYGTSFEGSDLRGASFKNIWGNNGFMRLGLDFSNTDLRGANFEGAQGYINLESSRIDGATRFSPKLHLIYKLQNNIEVGQNLSGVDLSDSELRSIKVVGANLDGANFSRSRVGGDFSRTTMIGTSFDGSQVGHNFSGALLYKTSFRSATVELPYPPDLFRSCNFDDSTFNTPLRDPKNYTRFDDCSFLRAKLATQNYGPHDGMTFMSFVRCTFTGSRFPRGFVASSNDLKPLFTDCDFSGAIFQSQSGNPSLSFDQVGLSNCRFNNSALFRFPVSGALFSGKVSGVYPNLVWSTNDFSGLTLGAISQVVSSDYDFRSANLIGADLSTGNGTVAAINCSNANLSNARFYGQFSGSSFVSADLRGANLFGADFSGNDLSFANLTGAFGFDATKPGIIFNKTIMPDGTVR